MATLPVYSKMKDSVPNLEERKKGAIKIRQDAPEKVPVVIERAKRSNLPELRKFKYLFNSHFTVAEVKEFIKGKLDIPQQLPLYFYINGLIPSKDSTMGALYQEYREPDYLLYIVYYEENIHF